MKKFSISLLMFLAAILCFPLRAFAEEFVLSPTQTTVIQADGATEQNADVVLYNADATAWNCSQSKISGGIFENKLPTYEGSPVVITKIDASEILNGKSLKKATLTFNSKCTVSGKNSNVQIASIGTGWDATTATWTNTNKIEILNAVGLNGDGVNVKTSTVTLTQDVTEILGADEDNVIGFAIFTFTGRQQQISNIKLTIEAIDASASSTYTIKYVDANGNELKASETRSESIGTAATITDADKASIYNEDRTTKYIYVSDDAAGQTINGDGSTVITVTFREAATWNYTINAVDGDGNLLKALKSGTNFEAETFDVAYGAYIDVDGTIYKSSKLSSDKKGYYFSMTLSADNYTKDVTFTASDITGVVYFSEAEDIEGLTQTNNSNTFIRSSNGASAYAADGDVVFTQLPNGKYKITTVICDASKNAGSVWNFKAGDNSVFEFTASSVNWAEGTSEEFELNQASTDIALAKNGGNNQGVDLIYIVKTGDAELAKPVPAYGVMDFTAMNIPVSTNNSTDGDITENKTLTADDFSITISPKASGSTNNRFWSTNNGPQLRIYNGTLTIKAAAGKVLDKIVFATGTWGTMTANVGTLDSKTWTGEEEEVVFTVTKQCQINSITVGEAPAEPLADAADIAAFKALEAGTKAKLALNGTKVTFVSGDNAYIEDETGALLLYKSGLTLTAGKALTGYINGAYTEYKGLAELTAIDETAASEFTEADTEIAATVVTVAEANTAENVSKLVKLENVKINADYQTITQGEDEIGFYDKFGVMGDFVYPETAKSIVGIINTVSGYNTFHPISPDNVVADTPNPPAGDDDIIALTADMFYTWDGYGADASKLSPATVDFNIGNDVEVGAGGMVCGTSSVDYLTYADLTGSSKMIIEGTPGMELRVLMNRQESNNGPLVEKNPKIGDDSTVELDLTDLEYIHINAIKTGWGSAAGKIASIKFVKPSDALAIPKEALKNIIETAKLHNAVAKTEESYAALQTAIANGETALAAEDATEESLTAAKNAIEEAIAGLTLMEGYSDLTKEMFMEYASFEEPGEGQAAYGAYSLFEASGLPYGDGNVNYLFWADLTAYDKLIITTVGETKPRLCLNRLTPDGQQAATKEDSKMVDINPNNDFAWSTEAYQTIDGNVYTIDLKKIVQDYTFARLHCIKKQGWGPDVFVTGMYLYSGGSSVVVTPCKEITEDYVFTMTEENIAKAVEETWAKGGTTRVDNKKGSVDPATGETLESAKAFPGIGLKKGNAGKTFSTCIKGAVKVIAYGATTSGSEARYVEVTATPTEGEAVTAKAKSEPNVSAVVELELDATKEYTIEYTGVNEEGAGADVVLHGVKFAVAGTVDPTPVAANIAAAKEADMRDTEIKLNVTGAKVTLYGGDNMQESFIEDETGALMVDFNISKLLGEDGVALNGYIIGKVTKDQRSGGIFRFESSDNTASSEFTKEATTVEATVTTIADINNGTPAEVTSKYIRLENVNVKLDGTEIYLTEGDQEINVNNLMQTLPNDLSAIEKFENINGIVIYGWFGYEFVPYGEFKAVEKKVEYTEVANIAALKANKTNLDVKLTANNLQVTVLEAGEQGSTMYVEDETGGIQMNDANGIFTEFGQTFNGTLVLKLVYDNDQNILSLETTDQTATESAFTSEVKDVVAKEVALADATSANYDLQLIKVMNVGMASKNIYYGEGEEDFYTVIVLTDGEKELLVSDMFGKLTAETLYDQCNATGIIMTAPEYNDNNEIVGTVDIFVPTGVGIEEIVPVENGRQWDFTAMSEADEALLAADTEHWTVNKYRYQNNGIAFNDEVIKVNGVELEVTKGLLFTAEATKLLLGSGVNGSNHFMQVQKGSSFKVTNLAVGDTVRMVVQTSSKNAATAAAPAASVANIIEGFEATTEAHTCTFVMCEAGDIVLKGDNCDLRFLTLEVKAGNPNEVANLREWNFTAWSEETKNNLAADAATITPDEEGKYPTVTPWRSYEKVGGPTEADPDHGGAAYWYGTAISGAEELTANGTVIAETKGLLFNTMSAGALAIAVDYPSTSLGTYEGPAYLWIGGKNNSFTIPNVKSGSKITLGIESHKNTDARGVKLTIDGNEIGSAVPTTYETFTITVPGELTDATLSDVVVTNTNGCHIYYITVDATGKIIDGISEVKTEVKVINNGVYTINGVKVRNAGESLNGLAKGMYIVGGKKIIIK